MKVAPKLSGPNLTQHGCEVKPQMREHNISKPVCGLNFVGLNVTLHNPSVKSEPQTCGPNLRNLGVKTNPQTSEPNLT